MKTRLQRPARRVIQPGQQQAQPQPHSRPQPQQPSQPHPLATDAEVGLQKVMLSSGPVCYRYAGEGPPLLLLHGWGGSSRYWQGTLKRLADVRSVYALDLPGYGESPPLSGDITPERMAKLVLEFANAMEMERFDLNGHSFSAGVTAYLAATRPSRIRRLVMTCASTFRSERERKKVREVHRLVGLWVKMRRPWMGRMPRFYRQIARVFFYQVPEDDGLIRESFEDFLRMDRRTGIESAMNAATPGYNTILQRITAPTLVIGARQDAVMPEYGPPAVAKLVPDSRLFWIENCGHLPMVERPQMYHHLLRHFLTSEV